MDPCFFLPCFHGPRASRLGHKRKEKNSVHNLPYGPRTRLIRGTCTKSQSYYTEFFNIFGPEISIVLSTLFSKEIMSSIKKSIPVYQQKSVREGNNLIVSGVTKLFQK